MNVRKPATREDDRRLGELLRAGDPWCGEQLDDVAAARIRARMLATPPGSPLPRLAWAGAAVTVALAAAVLLAVRPEAPRRVNPAVPATPAAPAPLAAAPGVPGDASPTGIAAAPRALARDDVAASVEATAATEAVAPRVDPVVQGAATRRTIQFTAPAGTRIIWMLQPAAAPTPPTSGDRHEALR